MRSVLRNSTERCSTSSKCDADALTAMSTPPSLFGEVLTASSIGTLQSSCSPQSLWVLRADLIDGRAHGDRLWINFEPEQRRAIRTERALQGGREFRGASHRLANRTVCFRQRDEIGLDQISAVHPRRVGTLLMHANGAVHTVVDDHEDDIQLALNGSGELLPVHLKTAVPVPGHHDTLRMS